MITEIENRQTNPTLNACTPWGVHTHERDGFLRLIDDNERIEAHRDRKNNFKVLSFMSALESSPSSRLAILVGTLNSDEFFDSSHVHGLIMAREYQN